MRSGLILLPALSLLMFACGSGQEEPDLLTGTVGRYESFHSRVLNEDRTMLIRLPDDYHASRKSYPVLYVLDAEDTARFENSIAAISYLSAVRRLPKLIVIGILNTDRTRDLTPVKVEQRPASGGGDRFLEFLISELVPHVEGTYRCAPHRILFGGSSAGTFALHALFSRPEAFSAYIASRPVLNSTGDYTWDSDLVLRESKEFLSETRSFRKTLYVDYGGHEDPLHDPAPIHRLSAIFEEKAPDGFRWKVTGIGESGYRSPESLTGGLLALFDGWYYPSDRFFTDGIAGGERHSRILSERLGYPIILADLVSESALIRLGGQLLDEDRTEEAVALLNHAVDAHPDSRRAHDALGEALKHQEQAQ